MLMFRELVALTLLAVFCTTEGRPDSAGFYFPSPSLFINPPRSEHSGGGSGGMAALAPASNQAADTNTGQSGASTATDAANASGLKEPSKCVYAIVGCCKVGMLRVDEECFSRFDCTGPFWGESPCRRESAAMAYQIVKKYMAAKEKEKREEENQAMEESATHNLEEGEESSPFDPIGPLPSRG